MPIFVFLLSLRCCIGVGYSFTYADFASCSHTVATPCDVQTALSLPGTSFWQTCNFNRPASLKSAADVLSKDTPLIMQVTEVDYPNPRQTVTTNLTRSVFEEVVRRREELKAQLTSVSQRVLVLEQQLILGLEPDVSGQIWLLLSMSKADQARLSADYNMTLQKDMQLFTTRGPEYKAIWPTNNYNSTCDNRLRLTPGAPHSSGALYHKTKVYVRDGFNTTFHFQVSGRNQACVSKLEAHATAQKGTVFTQHYNLCSEGGSDGFAFVIHNAGLDARGRPGGGLGYAGMKDTLAVEFDMFANSDLGDPNDMHVAVHVPGYGLVSTSSSSTRIGFYTYLRETGRNLQDGLPHFARIVYTQGLTYDPAQQPQWKASSHLSKFIKADGLGTLRVFVDDFQIAVINLPISLKYAINLGDDGKAFAGSVFVANFWRAKASHVFSPFRFTGSTGDAWQHHDILSWQFSGNYPPSCQ